MAEQDKAEILSVEAKALDTAQQMVREIFWVSQTTVSPRGRSVEAGPFWRDIAAGDEEATKNRLREMADLIGDLKRRMLG